MSIELSLLVPHIPTICHEDQTPDYQQNIVAAMKDVAKEIQGLKPDVIVLVSCHWPSTFFHYVDCTSIHKGNLTAMEAPDLIKGVSYSYPGDGELADELVQAGQKVGIPVIGVNDPDYLWDYGTVVPLRYLNPNETIPVINFSVALTASLEETYRWGEEIAEVLRKSEKRVVFVASGALSHNLVRGRHHNPTPAEHALDKQFIEYIMNKDLQSAFDMLPQYASMAKVESGGRHLAMLLSMITHGYEPVNLGECQSSGSWNAVISFGNSKISRLKEDVKKEWVM